MKRQKVKRFGITWTKNITRSLLIVGVINGMTPFFLSACNKEPCTEMGIAWVTEVVAVTLGYFVRGFKDTKEQEQVRLKEKEMDAEGTIIDLDEEEIKG